MKRYLSLFSLSILFTVAANAQPAKMYRDTTVHVFNGAKRLINAWTGGLNAPCFADMDLDGDGKMDLIVFDGIDDFTFRMNCFLNTGKPGTDTWVEAPQYKAKFPSSLSSWIRTYDADCDGDLDIFSYMNGGGMQLWKNEMVQTGTLQFTLATTTVNTHYAGFMTGIYVSRVDMPAIADLDNDGDFDVLNFSNAANFLEFHRNYSVDSIGTCTTLNKIYDVWKCWGYFYTYFGVNMAALPPDTSANPLCPLLPVHGADFPADYYQRTANTSRHSGSATLAVDLDGDQDKDILMTDISSAKLLYIQNCGNADSAYACAQDTSYPGYNVPAELSTPMGAAYYFDADNDGNKDLIYANFWGTGDDYDNSFFYKNTTNNTTNQFALQNKRFLGNTMIDVGTSAHPVFFDFSGDGLVDLFVANDFYSKNYVPKIAYYKNTGTATKPVFTLQTDDFANLSALPGIAAIYPTFGDLDGDSDPDMLVGENGGGLLYFQNVGLGTMAFITANYQSIGVGATAAPQLIDVDRDGKLDLIIGRRNGQISYFRNTGTTNTPVFSLITNNFGGATLDVGQFSSPALYNNNGVYELLVGSQSGWTYHYTNIDGNLSGNFTLEDSTFQDIYEPSRACPSVADIDGDGKYDLVIGNQEGGVVLYTQNSALSALTEVAGSPFFSLQPNPASDYLQIVVPQYSSGKHLTVTILDLMGKVVYSETIVNAVSLLPIEQLAAGLYICRLTDEQQRFVQPFVKE